MTETRRIEKIEIKLTPDEKDRIGQDFLTSNAPSLSAYVRARLLNERPEKSPFDRERINERPIPDAAPTVGPSDPLPARTEMQALEDDEASAHSEDFTRRVLQMQNKVGSKKKAEAIVKKEMRL